MLDKVRKIEEQRQRYSLGGGLDAIEKQHQRGKLTARERMDQLFDPSTFHELELWALPLRTGFEIDDKFSPADAVVIGYGNVAGRTVMAYAQDFTVLTGSQSAGQINKLTKVMETAVEMMIPYVSIVDSSGIRLQDAMGEPGPRSPMDGAGLHGPGSLMYSPPWASGVVPQIAVMLGAQVAGSSYSPILTDFLIMRRSPAVFMSLASPPVIREVTGVEVGYQEIGGTMLHAEVSGTCDIVVDSDEEGLEKCRKLLGFLPSNWKEKPPVIDTGDSPGRKEEFSDLVPIQLSQGYDMHKIISRIVDNGDLLEIKSLYAKNVIVCFARLGGQSVAIIANNPQEKLGAMDINSSDKMARFIRFCDAFNIPLIFLVDTIGYVPSMEEERAGLERHAAKVPYAICEATVPKITIYVRNCSRWGELAMCTGQMGADLVLAWPNAQIGNIDPEVAVDTIYAKEIEAAINPNKVRQERIKEFISRYNNLYHAGARGLIQDIIDPRDTRLLLIEALGWFAHKAKDRPEKKHGNIPL
ncbi:MAG: acyl-CoA carboxylase subunit beta [Chloroflexota bacterium]|nr:acyl-CoA carboxylase subunit beta [Chloroflexota bacterium]